MIVRRLGHSVILLEKGKHPRVVIGESSTPLANLLLEDLATRYDLPRLKPFAKYGTWRDAYPGVPCGLKRGFTFYHHNFDRPVLGTPDRDHQLLVAASPHDRIADTHWYRADLDAAFVSESRALGVEYLDEVQLESACEYADRVHLQGARNGESLALDARFVIDATGPRGFLHTAFGLQAADLPDYPHTQALYTHFRGVGRSEPDGAGEAPPYPVDDAAVHHIFEGGWIWVLRFNNGITSAGVAALDPTGARLHLREGAPAWERLLKKIPLLEGQFSRAAATMPFTYLPRLSFRSSKITGSRWALLPSAAGFVDPLLSTGFPLTLLGVSRIARLIEKDWNSPQFRESLDTYSMQTESELLAAARLIAAMYANMGNFPVFASLSLLYFAAASFSETARRLGKPHLAPSFLLHDDPRFGAPSVRLLQRARQALTPSEAGGFAQEIARIIEPFNIAGLGESARHNWYPVDPGDLFRAAGKVGATREGIEELLERSGFWEPARRAQSYENTIDRHAST